VVEPFVMTALCPPGPVVRRVLVPVTPDLPLGPLVVTPGTELVTAGDEPVVVTTTEWLGVGVLVTTGALAVGRTVLVVTGAWLVGAGCVVAGTGVTGTFVVGAWVIGACVVALGGAGASVVGVLTGRGTFTCACCDTVGTTGVVEGDARAGADSNGAANVAATAATAPIFLTAETGALVVIYIFLPPTRPHRTGQCVNNLRSRSEFAQWRAGAAVMLKIRLARGASHE
jgi:hypothetical protein